MKKQLTAHVQGDAKCSSQHSGTPYFTGQEHPSRRELSRERPRLFFAISVVASLVTALSFASCIRDYEARKTEKIDDMALVTLSLSTPATRAEATTAENAIDKIDVLLFDEACDEFVYRAHGTEITNQGNEPHATKKFEVRLPIGGPCKVVVIANAREAVQATGLPVATIVTSNGALRETALNSLVHAATPGMTNFPMWGELASSVTISETSADITPAINLTRAVARVDVSLAGTIDASTFKL